MTAVIRTIYRFSCGLIFGIGVAIFLALCIPVVILVCPFDALRKTDLD